MRDFDAALLPTMPNPLIDAIIVPQGAEHKAVCQGLNGDKPPVFPVSVGWQPLRRSLEQLKRNQFDVPQPRVLLMGLCGSLSPHYQVGDIVLYQSCLQEKSDALHLCDEQLTRSLEQILAINQVTALTTDRVICTAAEKHSLRQEFHADVVDMEGAIVIESLRQAGISVAMLRVVSDSHHHDIPDLNSALRADGSLDSWALAAQFLKKPIAATRLIQGAMRGLSHLQSVTTTLFP
ncbi:MAG: phosphorylase [Drouetiella hepatica Uher 2000/2452]|jgi:hypothetical protein|uniref:Phosphorylase n=1 Tax=Drouetiella hepatica Uher 2000/2452 TaxID=904376 RepID=A0A951QCG4_9CYAN|nr:phosphorylase [Drouetiella hepatica Uher 2000/2452]